MAETAGLVLAIPGVIDLCIKYGDFLAQKIKLFINVKDHASMHIFVLDLARGGIIDVLKFLHDEYNQLEQSYKDTLEDFVPLLADVLLKALRAFPEDVAVGKTMNVLDKTKYAMYDAKKIADAVKEMEIWTDRFVKRNDLYMKYVFDKRSTLLTQAQDSISSNVDIQDTSAEIQKARLEKLLRNRHAVDGSIIIPALRIGSPIPMSGLHQATDEAGVQYLAEFHDYNGKDSGTTKELGLKVRNIAKELRRANPSKMHILRCRGYFDDVVNKCFVVCFEIPEGECNPRSLRSLLPDPTTEKIGKKHSLSDRLRLAQSLATAVLYVHSCSYVHKNIRPENVIIFEPVNAAKEEKFPYSIGSAYLVGYDGVRKEELHSELNDPKTWKDRIYLPSERLVAKSERVKFTWRHDIYSLGVILHEIALWENFASDKSSTGKRLVKADAADPVKGLTIALQERERQVSTVFGDGYRAAVTACLSMLEMNVVKDEDGFALGTSYVSEVLDKIEAIHLG